MGNLGGDGKVIRAFRQLEEVILELANVYIHVDKIFKEGSPVSQTGYSHSACQSSSYDGGKCREFNFTV